MAEAEQSAKKKDRESSIRWQGRTIEQFGYSLNLILGLSVAALGFETTLVLNNSFSRAGWQTRLFSLSASFLVISIALGLWCVITRLRDFRITAKIARKREDGASKVELLPLRISSRRFGEQTWQLFWGQIVTFGLGLLLLLVIIVPMLFGNVK